MPIAITYRTDGAWGAGKGSNLVASEVDVNFYNIIQAIAGIELAEPKQIVSITIDGSDMTITLDDDSSYTVTVPTTSMRWVGDWGDGRDYEAFDIFLGPDGNVYFVNRTHSIDTGDEFNPDLTDMVGNVYEKMFSIPINYDLGFFVPGKPGRGLFAGDTMFAFRADRSFYFEDFAACVGGLEKGSVIEMTFHIFKNDEEIGTFVIGGTSEAASSDDFLEPQVGVYTYTLSDPVQFVAGDRLRVEVPAALDSFARDLTMTFAATRGTIPT